MFFEYRSFSMTLSQNSVYVYLSVHISFSFLRISFQYFQVPYYKWQNVILKQRSRCEQLEFDIYSRYLPILLFSNFILIGPPVMT